MVQLVDQKLLPSFGGPPLHFRPLALDAEAKLVRDVHREIRFLLRIEMRPLVIGHELADNLAVLDQRDERQRCNPFLLDRVLDGASDLRLVYILDEDWIRIAVMGLPWRVPGRRLPVGFGKAAPCHELHLASLVKQQYRRAAAGQRGADSVKGGLINLTKLFGPIECIRKTIEE